jgi:Domain of Unknown Function (DUF1080)
LENVVVAAVYECRILFVFGKMAAVIDRRYSNSLFSGPFFVTLCEMRKLFFCFALALAWPAVASEIRINFGDFPTNQAPSGFHSALAGGGKPGDWKIAIAEVPSAFAPLTSQTPAFNRRSVLAQLSQDPTDERFPMLIYDRETFKDFKLTTQFKIVSGGLEQMAGVVFRFQNESNFYVVRASALGNNLRFYKVVDGLRGNPIGPELNISNGIWHTLTVQCEGNKITCWLDDHLAMPPLNDSTFAVGKIGFWTKSDAVSYFGDTTIIYTPRVPMAQTLVRDIMQKYPRILGLRIYTLDDKGEPQILASKDEKEIGQPGTDTEKNAITNGAVFFGRGDNTVAGTIPLTDRNGDAVAAVRVQLKSFKGETQDTALLRIRSIVKEIQEQVTSGEELKQ